MQQTAFGEAELDTYLRVDRADGSVEFYHLIDGANLPITEAEYMEANR